MTDTIREALEEAYTKACRKRPSEYQKGYADGIELTLAIYDAEIRKRKTADLATIDAALSEPIEEQLSAREIHLIEGMIKVQKAHAETCDRIQNRVMAEKQKEFDLERVALLKKLLVLRPTESKPRVVPVRLFAGILAPPAVIRQVLAVVGCELEPLVEVDDSESRA